MFPHSRIQRASELKAPFLQCDKYFHTLPLTELHGNIFYSLQISKQNVVLYNNVHVYMHVFNINDFNVAMTPPDSSGDFDVHLERSLRDLKDLKEDLTYDVFMVYATADIPQNGEEQTKVAPRRIQDDLELNGFKV